MREVKFRAFVHKYQSISDVDSIDFQNKEILFGVNAGYMETDSESANFEDIELMEFTGMRDRKGNMIFEGDICKILFSGWASKNEDDTRTLEEYLWDKAETFIIQFDTNGFYATTTIGGWSECMEHGRHGFIEVIGNIYENPELIK